MAKLRKVAAISGALYGILAALVFVGVTSVARGEESDFFQIDTIASGLDHPWSIAFLPGGDLLVTERAGRLRLIKDGVLVDASIANTPDTYARSQGGYFDIVLHPDFAQNQIIYLSFAHGSPDANTTRIVRARYSGTALEDVRVIFDTAPTKDTPVHYGGRMAFLPDGSLLMTTGDGFNYREDAQRKNNRLGKTIRILDDGSVPGDNPFHADSDADKTIWTYGHRSPQGLAVDPESGTIYQHEHGPRGGDEVNILEAGKNYGWPIATYGIDYSGAIISPFTHYKNTEQPIHQWTPSIATSGLAIYRGDVFSAWDGDLLIGGLVTKALHRLEMKDGKVQGETRYLEGLDTRIRDVRIGPDGAIYVTTDEGQGKVLRLTPKDR